MKRKKVRPENDPELLQIAINPEYEELERQGKLRRVLELRIKHRKLMDELAGVLAETQRCSGMAWMDKFALRLSREGKNVAKNLQSHFDTLDLRRRKLIVRARTVFQEIIASGANYYWTPESTAPKLTAPLRPPTFRSGRNASVQAQYRDFMIQMHGDLPNKDLCNRLDFDLERRADGTVSGLPGSWTKQYGVKTFGEAYTNKKCRGLVQKLISKAKQGI